ncbi:MAG: hypothetical protein WC712_07030 [Candidatus Brocadiia bacterium]
MARFEYHVVENISEKHLDEMGAMGWELLAVVQDPKQANVLVYYFKRVVE